jgi:hypothetical protein
MIRNISFLTGLYRLYPIQWTVYKIHNIGTVPLHNQHSYVSVYLASTEISILIKQDRTIRWQKQIVLQSVLQMALLCRTLQRYKTGSVYTERQN